MFQKPKLLSKEELLAVYNKPLLNLVYEAATVHRQYHDPRVVQISSLVSIKTGGCTEDCGYCPQAARYTTDIKVHKLMSVEEVVDMAKKAKAAGSSRVCLGAAWREVKDNKDFDRVIEMVEKISEMNMEVCCTLGMLNEMQAKRLEAAGLYAYNHNLDTSESKYKEIITTRNYQNRLDTIANIRKTKITVCSGGIIGMGESVADRIDMLYTLSHLDPQPESVPINALVPVEGTPLANQKSVSAFEMVRMVATTRIAMPLANVRLSAGRTSMSQEAQALCFLAGANSIFAGDKLLTTPNPSFDEDMAMFETLGLLPQEPFAKKEKLNPSNAKI